MNNSNKWGLRAWLNRMLEDGIKVIKAKDIAVFAHDDNKIIEDAINEWQARKILIVLKPYKECGPEDYCVELLQFIDQKSPIKGYMNWE